MRTNIVLDDALVQEAITLTHAHSKREVVNLALQELVARRKQAQLLRLPDRSLIDPDYDIKAVRAAMGEVRASGAG